MSLPALPAGLAPGPRFAEWGGVAVDYVVCDVDGTLLGADHTSSDAVVEAVRAARAADLTVGYATGRMRDAVTALHAQLDLPGPHVLHNGAEVRADGATVVAWTLTTAQVDGLLAVASVRDDVYVEIYPSTGFLASSLDDRAKPHWELLGTEPRGVIRSGAEVATEQVLKATFAVFDPRAVDEIVEVVAALGMNPGPASAPSSPGLTYVNATHPDADKGRAVLQAAAHLGVPIDRVAAIGDADNDRSMLERVGTAIAMGQAPAEVKAHAHLVAPSVDDDGVAVALHALVAARREATAPR